MLLRSAPVQAAFDVWDADKADLQPLLDASDADATSELTAADIVEVEVSNLRAAVDLRRPRITRVRPPSFSRAKAVVAATAPVKPTKLPPPLPPPTRRTVPPVPSAPSIPPPPDTISEQTMPDCTGARPSHGQARPCSELPANAALAPLPPGGYSRPPWP